VELRQVECFLAVAEHLHFAKAAEELHLGQTTVSESIRRLEQELGGALFVRSTRRVELTPLGQSFLIDARAAFDAMTSAFHRAQAFATTQGSAVVVGYCYDVERRSIFELVPEFRRRNPGALVDFRPLSTGAQMARLHRREVDVCVCYVPGLEPEFASAPLGSTTLVALVPADHRFAHRSTITLADLASEPLVLFPRLENPNLFARFTTAMDATGMPWRLAATALDIDNLAARALAGLGIAIGLAAAVPTMPSEGVVAIDMPDAPIIEKVLVWRCDEARKPVLDLVELISGTMHV
jgi:DNA-binding transcriptional LysR family regulator